MHTQVFISSCVNIYCVLSAAHLNFFLNFISPNLTLRLWHMVKGRCRPFGGGSSSVAQRVSDTFLLYFFFNLKHIRAGKREGSLYETSISICF